MKHLTASIIRRALDDLNLKWKLEHLPDIDIEIPKEESMGDCAVTVAMRLARPLRNSPGKIAEMITAKITEISSGSRDTDIFEDISIDGPGFINFRFKKDFFLESMRSILEHPDIVLRSAMGKGLRIQVEFVSANPTGPLHVGHGRGAAAGNALCNLLSAAGYDVEKEFYINDAGLQMKLLGRSVYTRYQQLTGNNIPFPENGYKGDYITSLAEEIRTVHGDSLCKQTFEECDDEITGYAYRKMLANLRKDLEDFGVNFDRWQSEKELHSQGKVASALDALNAKDLLYEKDGALWFRSSQFEDEKDRVVRKQDGEFTYFASDICYHKDKLDRGFHEIIDIWGADHHGYIPRIKSVLEAFSLPADRFRVILIQMVSLLRQGQPVQMSKRAGEFVTLRDVMDEVGADITKFIFLTRKADSHLDFDIAVAKEQSSENPVFYVQYAFARISSIFRQAGEKGIDIPAPVDADLTSLQEEDIGLIRKILYYPIVFEGAVRSCEPHRITYYLQELASAFHSYYYKHRVISDDPALTIARLCLCRGVKTVLEEGLGIIGVSAPERM